VHQPFVAEVRGGWSEQKNHALAKEPSVYGLLAWRTFEPPGSRGCRWTVEVKHWSPKARWVVEPR
jgi:hypothetical protein